MNGAASRRRQSMRSHGCVVPSALLPCRPMTILQRFFRAGRVTRRTHIVLIALLTACTPSHDWREVHGTAAPFSVLMPAKPSTLARKIDLAGTPLTMTMLAAEVDGVTYAVGSIDLPDAAQAKVAIEAMKTAMVKNIRGTVLHEKAADLGAGSAGAGQGSSMIELDALGTPPNGRPRLLLARFVAHHQHAYQVIVTGARKSVAREQADTFLTSFKPQ